MQILATQKKTLLHFISVFQSEFIFFGTPNYLLIEGINLHSDFLCLNKTHFDIKNYIYDAYAF